MINHSSSSMRELCTFSVDGQSFAVPVGFVQEVLRQQPMTAVPAAPKPVAGLINLRGQIVTAVDLKTRLGILPEPDPEHGSMNIIVHTKGDVVSFLVDNIGDVLDFSDCPTQPLPSSISPLVAQVVDYAVQTPTEIILVLDPDAVADI